MFSSCPLSFHKNIQPLVNKLLRRFSAFQVGVEPTIYTMLAEYSNHCTMLADAPTVAQYWLNTPTVAQWWLNSPTIAQCWLNAPTMEVQDLLVFIQPALWRSWVWFPPGTPSFTHCSSTIIYIIHSIPFHLSYTATFFVLQFHGPLCIVIKLFQKK